LSSCRTTHRLGEKKIIGLDLHFELKIESSLVGQKVKTSVFKLKV